MLNFFTKSFSVASWQKENSIMEKLATVCALISGDCQLETQIRLILQRGRKEFLMWIQYGSFFLQLRLCASLLPAPCLSAHYHAVLLPFMMQTHTQTHCLVRVKRVWFLLFLLVLSRWQDCFFIINNERILWIPCEALEDILKTKQ